MNFDSNILSDAVELDSFYIRNRLVVNCGDLYKSQRKRNDFDKRKNEYLRIM